jgi:hypothetical protein
MVIGEHFENIYSNILQNLEEISKFLDAYNLPKLSQEDINHLNKSVTSNGIEAEMVSQQRKAQDWMDSLLNSTKPLTNNLTNAPQTIP